MFSPSHPASTEIQSLAQQTGFSVPAVEAMRRSIVDGGGRMAQFDHPEFGGAGQWMKGGLLMISDFSDAGLKTRIAGLCDVLSAETAHDPGPTPAHGAQFQRQFSDDAAAVPDRSGSSWYPAALGTPDSSGAQDGTRYAWFGRARRLAVDDGESVTVYDTGDHRIGGVSQHQGMGRSVSFVSQHGAVEVDRLPVVDGIDTAASVEETAAAVVSIDPFVALEKLAGLHGRGIIDDHEFATKKAELLRRI